MYYISFGSIRDNGLGSFSGSEATYVYWSDWGDDWALDANAKSAGTFAETPIAGKYYVFQGDSIVKCDKKHHPELVIKNWP